MHIAIIGNGIAGITAGRFIRKLSDHNITVISSETDHFFSRTALMYIYMGHMRYEDTKPYEDWFWDKNRIDLLNDHVTAILTEKKELQLKENGSLSYDKLIIATGSKPNKFGWPGQDLERVQGLYAYQDVESMEAATADIKKAVIVGGGLIGIEMAEMFHSRHIPVTFLVRESSYWEKVLPKEESAMVTRQILKHGIDLQLGEELKEIEDDGTGKAGKVLTKSGQSIDCQFVGLTAGVHPNIQFLKGSEIETDRGILVDELLKTNLDDIYAIGDCAQLRKPPSGRKPIEAVWYVGRMMGETVAHTICGQAKKYDPGIWFNSAKFMDIEYQVYGDVQANPPDNHQSVYWEHEDGEKSIRVVYEKETEAVIGFNLMGIRFRQEVCEKWIREQTNIEKVLQDLALANFDPEFYRSHEEEVLDVFQIQTGRSIPLKSKRSLSKVLSFLHS